MKKLLIAFLFSLVIIQAGEITIAVAANVSYAIDALKQSFNKTHPTIKVNVILGSSGKLTAQITHGAPYMLFMSADMKFPNRLYDENLTVTKPVIYAQGALAILSQKERNYCAEIFVLKDPDIHRIAIANPRTAPYGIAAAEALTKANLYKNLKKKFVFGESISQTVSYATTAADIGIIAKSSLYSPHMSHYKEAIHWSEVDETLYTPINQGMVILNKGKNNAEVKAFYDFMLGAKAKVVLEDYGYKVP